jgi:hypothetical protein
MADNGIRKLIEEARKNPEFLHDLVFDTEKVLTQIDYLSRVEKAAILAVDPDRFVAGLVIGGVFNPGGPVEGCGISCWGSCGGMSCGDTCTGTCGGTCLGSCDESCGGSCGATCVGTSNFNRLGNVVDPEVQAMGALRSRLGGQSFARYRR